MAVFNLVYQAAGYLYLSKGKSPNGVNPRRDFMGGLVPDQPHISLRVQGGVFYVRITWLVRPSCLMKSCITGYNYNILCQDFLGLG